MKSFFKILTIVFFLFSNNSFADQKKPEIISSIKPIDSLVRMISTGVNEVDLIIDGNRSPHGFNVKPSHIEKINNAKIIFYVDDKFEEFLPNILENATNIKKVSLLNEADLRLFKSRNIRNWEIDKTKKNDKYVDYHFWLDTKNAKEILLIIKKELTQIYPQNKEIYEKNYQIFENELYLLYAGIKNDLKDLKNEKFMVFHDAFQYFENQFSLNNIGYISKNPHFNVSIKSLRQNRLKVRKESVKCVFSESQFNKKFSNMVAKSPGAKVMELDPLGFNLKPSKNLYFQLMKQASNSFRDCLKIK